MNIQHLSNEKHRLCGTLQVRRQCLCLPLRVLSMTVACLFLTHAYAYDVKEDTIQKKNPKQEVVKQEVVKQEVVKQEAVKQEIAKQTNVKQETAQKKAFNQEIAKKEVSKKATVKTEAVKLAKKGTEPVINSTTKKGIVEEMYKDRQESFYKCYASEGNNRFEKVNNNSQPSNARRLYKNDYYKFMQTASGFKKVIINSMTEQEKKNVLVKDNPLNFTFYVNSRGRLVHSFLSMKKPVTNQLSAETIQNIFNKIKNVRLFRSKLQNARFICHQTIRIN